MIVALYKPTTPPLALLGVTLLLASTCLAFVIPSACNTHPRHSATASVFVPPIGDLSSSLSFPQTSLSPSASRLFSTPEDESTNDEGASLAAEFFKLAQAKGVSIDESDLLDDDDDEEEDDEDEDDFAYEGDALDDRSQYASDYDEEYDDDDEEDDDEAEPNIPQGAIDAFVGYDINDVDANPTVDIPNAQLYGEVKDRVLDTAGGFVDMLSGPGDEDDDEDGGSDAGNSREYVPPATVPDPELTAGEVVLLVLSALKNNDNPYVNKGVEILFGYSSPGSQIKQEEGLTPAEYGEFLKETEYKALFEHLEATIEKGEYSFEGKKGFFTARLQTGLAPSDCISVNFILSGSSPDDDDAAWLIDSILIRPRSVRRRRRR
mmetsp:Transcript_10977/g.31830  ORF Transcript_10977/g.31830 Transcript_10977/m.31830 type:complete len:377 (-) Transcript_10977:351-1481(-)